MIPFRKTLGFRLVLMGFFGLTLPLIIDAAIVFTKRYETRVQAGEHYLTETAITRVLPIASLEPFSEIAFDVLVDNLGIQAAFPKKPDEKLSQELVELARINQLDNLTLYTINEEGQYIATASAMPSHIGQNETRFFADPNPFVVAENFTDPIATYLFYDDSFKLYLVLAKGYQSPDGKAMGVVAASVNIDDWVAKVLAEDTTYYPVHFALVNEDTIVMAATDRNLLFQYFEKLTKEGREAFDASQRERVIEAIPEDPLVVTEPMRSGKFMRFMWQGREQFGVMEPMPWWDYSILSYASKRDIFLLPLENFLGIFVSYTVILILGGITVFFLTRRWMRPVQTLGSVMMQVHDGDFTARYETDRWGYRINELGVIFNQMIENLLENKARAEKERLQRDLFLQELKLGKEAQQRLLKEPDQDFGVVEVAQSYIPASEVGGDFYDIFRKPNGKLVVTIADASGKGVLACCYSLAARNMLHTLAMSFDDVGEVLQRGNNLFCDDTGDSGMFVTVEMGQYDYETRELSYYSLGHNPGIVCRHNGTVEMLTSQDMAMGVLPKEEKRVSGVKQLEVGDLFVLYTDGVTEMHNPESNLFGEERLIQLIQQNRSMGANDLRRKIEEEVYAYAGGRDQFDDFTLIVVKING